MRLVSCTLQQGSSRLEAKIGTNMTAGLGLRFHLAAVSVSGKGRGVLKEQKELAWKAEREELCVTVRMVRATCYDAVRKRGEERRGEESEGMRRSRDVDGLALA